MTYIEEHYGQPAHTISELLEPYTEDQHHSDLMRAKQARTIGFGFAIVFLFITTCINGWLGGLECAMAMFGVLMWCIGQNVKDDHDRFCDPS